MERMCLNILIDIFRSIQTILSPFQCLYQNRHMWRNGFSFFEGLIPEGWLLDIASENWRINKNDRMGLLLACCRDCIGAVSVEPIIDNDD